jgi:AcrR family transcriptional regulator
VSDRSNDDGAVLGPTSRRFAKGNPTKSAILEAAVTLLSERGPDGFTIDEVLILSDASASSLYHHFGNREGLLRAAERERYRSAYRGEDRRNLERGEGAQTSEEFFDYIAAQLRRIVTDPANVEVRRSRLQAATKALNAPDLAEEYWQTQEEMFDAIVVMLDDAQARGLINPDVDTRAYEAWFHGMTLGRTFTEGGSVDARSWLEVAIPAALAPLRPPDPTPPRRSASHDDDGSRPERQRSEIGRSAHRAPGT